MATRRGNFLSSARVTLLRSRGQRADATVVPLFLSTQLGLPMLIDGRLMTAIVAVALAMQDMPRREDA